eukprot:TRINITY_DN8942_c0_g2_i3.p1 TRINITY_DN8942_c0_g2~~TRINITY_DN8942_c0_g2_i3.p1  ORF type:complete len:226 (+),score=21.93 TRINITY_DN8942_c0_g2_i3:61-678(+)
MQRVYISKIDTQAASQRLHLNKRSYQEVDQQKFPTKYLQHQIQYNRRRLYRCNVVGPEEQNTVIKSVSEFDPGQVEVGWQIYVGFLAGVFPFAIGLYEFVKRILIQVRCEVCEGSGLVTKGRFQRKCPQCGGFFPWRGWGEFLSANADPGNGGVLRFPKGQTSVFYEVPPAKRTAQPGNYVDADGNKTQEDGDETAKILSKEDIK